MTVARAMRFIERLYLQLGLLRLHRDQRHGCLDLVRQPRCGRRPDDQCGGVHGGLFEASRPL